MRAALREEEDGGGESLVPAVTREGEQGREVRRGGAEDAIIMVADGALPFFPSSLFHFALTVPSAADSVSLPQTEHTSISCSRNSSLPSDPSLLS